MEWYNYTANGCSIKTLSSFAQNSLMSNSCKHPIFVELLNDACVLSQHKIIVFGHQPTDYFRALLFWLECVCTQHQYKLYGSGTTVHALIELLLNHTPFESSSSSSGANANQQNDDMRAGYYLRLFRQKIFAEYQRLASVIATIGQTELNGTTSVFADTDERGMSTTKESGWE